MCAYARAPYQVPSDPFVADAALGDVHVHGAPHDEVLHRGRGLGHHHDGLDVAPVVSAQVVQQDGQVLPPLGVEVAVHRGGGERGGKGLGRRV